MPGSPENTYQAGWSTTSTMNLTSYGGSGGTTLMDRCPANQFVGGIVGRSGDPNGGSAPGNEVVQFRFICVSMTVARIAGGANWGVTVSDPTSGTMSPARGGNSTTQFRDQCQAGQVAVQLGNGQTGSTTASFRRGDRIDRIGIGCAPITLSTI
jgi:hypothetical protein